MSLIFDLDELKKQCARMEQKTKRQQEIYFKLINGIVKLHQENRVANNYPISDALRELLNSVGVSIMQGSAGYEYDKIPPSLKGRPVDDTWAMRP
jgi:hypothetical protein